jgi:hypothetical protein
MDDRYKTKAQLITELEQARSRLAGMDAAETAGKVSTQAPGSAAAGATGVKQAPDHIRATEELQRVLLYGPAVLYSLKTEGKGFALQWISESVTTMTGYPISEALTNVLRHARAKTVWVQVNLDDSDLQLVIRDGVGFDIREALSLSGPNTSLGLQGMQERAAAAGESVEIRSRERHGCRNAPAKWPGGDRADCQGIPQSPRDHPVDVLKRGIRA